MLRAPFIARTLSHSGKAIQVLWGDGANSTFSNTWLRSSIRDPKFFNATSSVYREEYLSFVAKDAPIASAELTAQPDDDVGKGVKVCWEDHSSVFDASWLRAQDSRASSKLMGELLNEVPWDGTVKIPEYDFADKDTLFESWMLDLRRFGLIIVKGVPTTEKGLLDFMQKIGPPRQRLHPTNVFTLVTQQKQMAADIYAYGPKPLSAHTDTSFYKMPSRIESFLCLEYSAPKKDTVNYFVDSSRVIEVLRHEDPETFHILTTTKLHQGRRRTEVEEPCDDSDKPMYEWDTYTDTPPIIMEGDKVKRLQFSSTKHGGYPMYRYGDDHMKKFFRAYQVLQERLNDPKYHHYCIITPGNCTVFDNHRVCHGRLGIDPSTKRCIIGCYVADGVWNSRWRLILGKRSGLADRWLYSCTEKALEILSQRMET